MAVTMRIAILGYSGAGKSTLARALGKQYGCPVLHMDTLHFRANWQERPDESARFILSAYLDNPGWVIDGNYGKLLFDERMEAADRIVLLSLPRFRCMAQAYGRYRRNRGKSRASIAPGCEEKFDREFFRWLLWEGRRKNRRLFRQVLANYGDKVLVCRSRRDTARLLSKDPLHI